MLWMVLRIVEGLNFEGTSALELGISTTFLHNHHTSSFEEQAPDTHWASKNVQNQVFTEISRTTNYM